MSNRRGLRFNTEEDALTELRRLRNGYTPRGQWTLAQNAWHVSSLIEKFLNPPADPTALPTAEQKAMKAGFVDYMLANRTNPPHAQNCPPPFLPPATANEADIDRFEAQLRRLKSYSHPVVEMGPVGPVPTEECRQVHLVHTEHHLAFLEPASDRPDKAARRSGLAFKDTEAVIADVNHLRHGYHRAGNWTLPQIAWHLEKAIRMRMQPGPFAPNTHEQDARRPMLQNALSSGNIPSGIVAPDPAIPPPDAGEESIDALIKTLGDFKVYSGPIAPHRLFGHLSDTDARKLNLIHCAHHLSHLAPVTNQEFSTTDEHR